jgi:hypothetical protein
VAYLRGQPTWHLPAFWQALFYDQMELQCGALYGDAASIAKVSVSFAESPEDARQVMVEREEGTVFSKISGLAFKMLRYLSVHHLLCRFVDPRLLTAAHFAVWACSLLLPSVCSSAWRSARVCRRTRSEHWRLYLRTFNVA